MCNHFLIKQGRNIFLFQIFQHISEMRNNFISDVEVKIATPLNSYEFYENKFDWLMVLLFLPIFQK